MKKNSDNIWNYGGVLAGFIGAVLMAYAIGEIESATYYPKDCTGSIAGKTAEAILSLMKECERHIIGLQHPQINQWGLVLLSIGFLMQFRPALPLIKKWIVQKLPKSKGLKLN